MLSPSPGGQKLEIKQLMALAPLRGSAEKPGFLQLSQPLGAGNSPWPVDTSLWSLSPHGFLINIPVMLDSGLPLIEWGLV